MSVGRATPITLFVAAALLALTLGASEARAVVTTPIPTDAGPTPPPVATLPPAGDAQPPAEAISDLVEPAAACGGWYLASKYGGEWQTSSTWWEYSCTYLWPGCNYACNADYVSDEWIDYFYWDGAKAVFYGEYYADQYWPSQMGTDPNYYWWDQPTNQWYRFPPPSPPPNVPPTASFTVACSGLTCSFDPNSSSDNDGVISFFRWNFGDNSSTDVTNTNPQDNVKQHTYAQSGSYTVTLSVWDDRSGTATTTREVTVEGTPPPPNAPPTASFTYACSDLTCTLRDSGSSDPDGTIGAYAWNFGDGSGEGGSAATTKVHTYFQPGTYTAGLTVTDNGGAANTQWQVITVKANAAPTAAFTVSCTALHCTFDAGASADSDGSIASFGWSYGDGSSGSGKVTSHDYPKAGAYGVTLTVTDDTGASATAAQNINPISLSARGYKQSGQQKVDLSWNGVAGTSFDVYRDGAKIASLQATAYTDVVPKGPGSHKYRVCATAAAACSNDATVSF